MLLSISQNLRFEANAGFRISEAGIFFEFFCPRVYEAKNLSVFTYVSPPVLTCTLKIEQSGTGTFQLRRAPIRLIGSQNRA